MALPSTRAILFISFCVCIFIFFWSSLVSLFHLALQNDYCTHILIVPFISMFLVCLDRHRIFRSLESSYIWGTLFLVVGAGLYIESHDSLSVIILSFVASVMAGFFFCFGGTAFKSSAFPLCFLLLMVPLPAVALDRVIYFLQAGSVAIANQLFGLLSVPVARDHFTLQLPGFTVEVAKECSSIRSSMALLITGLLAAHLFLQRPWTRFVLVALTIPLAVFKNAVRIVTLCMLAMHVDPAFMAGDLHRDGGIVFYGVALAIFCGALQLLRFAEKRASRTRSSNLSRIPGSV